MSQRATMHKGFVARLNDAGIRVSLFIDPDPIQIEASARAGAQVVELHTGAYCEAAADGSDDAQARALERLRNGARIACDLGLEVHAGHGLSFDTVGPVAGIGEVVELNIGHFLIGEAIFCGLDTAIRRMRSAMDHARAAAFSRPGG